MAVRKMSKTSKPVVEKKTGERYASKAAMGRHEKGETKSEQRAEVRKKKK